MGRKSNEQVKEFAFLLYMQGISLVDIRERVGIGSSATLNKWIKDGGWKEKRATSTVTREELVNKILDAIAEYIKKCIDEGIQVDPDKLAKYASSIEKLDKKASPVTYMEVFIVFNKWLQNLSAHEKAVDLEFLKKVNHYQDSFITQKLNS